MGGAAATVSGAGGSGLGGIASAENDLHPGHGELPTDLEPDPTIRPGHQSNTLSRRHEVIIGQH